MVLALLLAPVMGMQIGDANYKLPLMLLLLTCALVPLTMPHAMFIVCCCFFTSSVIVPFSHPYLTVFLCASLWLTAYTVMSCFVYKERIRFNHLHYLGIAISVLIIFLMFYRGFGLSFLGSSQVGGFRYFAILSSIGFFLSTSCIVIRPRWWLVIFVAFGLGSLIPLLADFLIYRNLGNTLVYNFVSTSGQTLGSASQLVYGGIDDQFIMRLYSGKDAAIYLTITLVALVGSRKLLGMNLILYSLPLLVIFTLAAISGFRLAMLSVMLIIIIASWLDKALSTQRLLVFSMLGVFGLVVLYSFAHQMPLSIQRSLAFLPFLELDYIAKSNASGTLHWRFQLWQMVVPLIPEYWLIGKGLLFNTNEFLYNRLDALTWAFINSSYHSGPLSALVLFGLPGFLLVAALSVFAIKRHLRIQQGSWASTMLRRMHLAMFCNVCVTVGVFWILYGDVHVSLPPLFQMLAICEGLRRTDLAMREKKPAEAQALRADLQTGGAVALLPVGTIAKEGVGYPAKLPG